MFKIISKLVFYVLILAAVLGVFNFGLDKLSLVLAQNINDSGISYPIEELGNCASKSECKIYCDKKANQGICLDFAEQKGMMKKTEIDQAKRVLQLSEQGIDTPGACKGQEECDAYCSDSAHLDECVTFGEKAGLISPEEVKMIKKTGGKGPGGCSGKKACDSYCENEANLDECISFAEQNGMMTAQEKEIIKKTGGKGPGGCKRKAECDAFCQQENNFDTCLEFGHQNGMMNDEEYATAKKMGPKMMSQGGPGGCRGKEECDAFCQKEENFQACIDFGHENGFMSDEEYTQAKKMGPKAMQSGPGGCSGKDECKSFCDNPANGEECMKFAVSSGMMSEAEAAKMKERGFMAPPKDALGANGKFMGPGGCKTQEECGAFCSRDENKQVCSMFGAGLPPGQESSDGRQMAPGTAPGRQPAGPGGCNSPTACMKFCSESANQDTCMRFTPPSPREDQTPGDFQVFRRESDQNQSQQPGSPDDRVGQPGQQGPGPQNVPGEQRERMEPGQLEFGAPPPQGDSNQPREENRLNEGLPLREGQPFQSPTSEGGQQPAGIQPAGQMEQTPFVQQTPPAQQVASPSGSGEIQPPPPTLQPAPQVEQASPPAPAAPAPSAESAPAPQALNAPRLLISALNFFASAMASFFSR